MAVMDLRASSRRSNPPMNSVVASSESGNMSAIMHEVVKNHARDDELVDEGLLIKEMTSDPKLQYVLHLTEKGEKIGQRMSECLRILKEE